MANNVLAYLSGTKYEDDIFNSNPDALVFTEKETEIIAYLGGYVFFNIVQKNAIL